MRDILSGICLIVHEEKVDVARVVDKEDLVAGWCQVLGLLVAAISNLYHRLLAAVLNFFFCFTRSLARSAIRVVVLAPTGGVSTCLWHSSLACYLC
jgi:hypothetical protein